LLVKTPSESVELSESDTGRALFRYFDERFLGLIPQNRLCRGVLILPDRHETYRRGPSRQALRRNLRRAQRAGIRCEQIADRSQVLRSLGEILASRKSTTGDTEQLMREWQPILARPELTLYIARDGDERPLALTAAAVDREVCLIQLAVASSYDARWALHDHLVAALIDRGVRYLLAEGDGPFGALGFSEEVHHYQHLLGYELRHLVPRRASSG
jgi:hypothetical protein